MSKPKEPKERQPSRRVTEQPTEPVMANERTRREPDVILDTAAPPGGDVAPTVEQIMERGFSEVAARRMHAGFKMLFSVPRAVRSFGAELSRMHPGPLPTVADVKDMGFSHGDAAKVVNGLRLVASEMKGPVTDLVSRTREGALSVPLVATRPLPKDPKKLARVLQRMNRYERKAEAARAAELDEGGEAMLHRGAPDLDGTAPDGRD